MTTPGPELTLLRAALAGDEVAVDAALADRAQLPTQSIPCALALANPAGARSLTTETVDRPLPPYDWPPLLYLCHSRYRIDDAETNAARLALAETLLGLGADPNVGTREAETIRGYRTALGAAVGCAASAPLTQRLLAAGADIADGPTLYEGSAMWEAVRQGHWPCLRALVAAKPPQWHLCHALPHSLGRNDLTVVKLLLENGGDPNWTMGIWAFKGNCLHEAVVLDNDPDIVRALLAHGADVDFKDRDGRTPLALATCLNRSALLAVLREHGASDKTRAVDRWVGACFAGDGAAARRLAVEHSGLPDAIATLHDASASVAERERARLQLVPCFKTVDHLWVCRAVGRAPDDAPVALGGAANETLVALLAGGLDPNAMDDDGQYALHLAAAGNAPALNVLLDNGADHGVRNFRGQTTLDVALAKGQHMQVQALTAAGAPSSDADADAALAAVFEAAADAVVAGDIDGLQALLRQHPRLASARSSRPHHCTLLNHLGANGFEDWRQRTPPNAVAVIDLLIDAGADANAVCYTYRGGPGENTLGLLTSSDHPKEAGLTLAMASALARGGARLDSVYRCLVDLYEASRADDLAAAARRADAAGLAFVECAMLGETEILFALADAGVDVDSRRGDGATALHQAAIAGDAELVDALLERGADPSLRDEVFSGNAAGWAFAGGHDELGNALRARLTDAV